MASLPQMLARQVVGRLAGGQGQGPTASPMGAMAPAAMNANGGPQAGDQVSKQMAELQGADPGAILQSLTQVKSILVALYPRTAFTIPGVARNLAQSQKYLDNAIKEAEQAAATQQTVQPIANNAAISNPSSPGMGLQDFASGGGA